MPPRPFPFALGIGTDICHRKRIEQLLLKPPPQARKKNLTRFLVRFLTSREISIFWRKFEDESGLFASQLENVTRYLAGRWAAKEATIKACQWRQLSFKHIQILRQQGGLRADQTGATYALILDKPASAFQAAFHSRSRDQSFDFEDNAAKQDHSSGLSSSESIVSDNNTNEQRREVHPPSMVDEHDFISAEVQNEDLPGQIAKISISHDGEYATAVCMAAEEPMDGDVGGEAAARELR
ncbi:hypothetical protein D0869_10956 [Hortaea werneckii]|uniref:4'-phosphopantetheinyl transferase domain-containing protein n=1 Tax=Hortaea werneckii TaxID=91943 RepID=A0A3M6WCP2_HORWE|nr:hypothetical protein KC334_g2705 [Hortaea werneckii]KAI7025479.1 hypothetical protein KC355_g1004 [Hortaea werneckii]KAI7197050.1 hypothetical protein KC324_g4299 [Hortaea werneckii]KAI7574932.1 hypothetical protein KC316_g11280 [Hortaea werneckii]KAI7662832.1 hypothetical protein KC318_g8651 [Hortaea werneckii]